MRTAIRLSAFGLCACAAALTVVLTGCGSSAPGDSGRDGDPAKSEAQVSTGRASTPPAGPDAKEKAAVLAAYDGMTAEQAKAYRQASEKGTALERYATLDALGQIRNDLARLKKSGAIVRGGIGHHAQVTALDMTAKTPKASLSDCIDLSKYETYDTKAKKVIPLPTTQPLRYRATATAERWEGRWMVTDINTQGGGSC
jgi:hypothetical protein